MESIQELEPIYADQSVDINAGSVKVNTPQGTFLISVGEMDLKGRPCSTVKLIPINHPGKKKVVVRKIAGKGLPQMALVQCKSVKK